MQILLIDDKVPDPHFGAGFPRAYRLLISLLELGHSIHFLPTIKRNLEELDLDLLQSYGVTVHEDHTKIPRNIDLVFLSRPHNVHYFLPTVKTHLPNARIIYDTEALWYRRYELQLAITGRLPGWAYRYDELGLARQVDLCFVVNNVEKDILEQAGVKKVVKLAHALDIHRGGLAFADRANVLVVGGKLESDSSNEDGLWWYLENAWEQVRERTVSELSVTGEVLSPRLKLNKYKNVNLLGHIAELGPLYENHRIFVAATRFATGIPWKVHEAMAHGIPCVVSKLLADQLELVYDKEAMVGNTPEEFIAKSIQLYSNAELWNRVRENGYNLVARDCDPEHFKAILKASLSELV